jgi:drug/metabolite transporter (DMT)-like permease
MSKAIFGPAIRGCLLALLAAVLFGLSTPLLQRAGEGLGAFTIACLLYTGAAIVAVFLRRSPEREAALCREDLPRLLAMAGFGAVIAPVALAWGLQRTSGSSASLMLTLEALFTTLLAWRLYGESMGRRVGAAMVLLFTGGIVLVVEQGIVGSSQFVGLIAILLATMAWGVDNAISRGVSDRDPGQVVFAKASLGAVATFVLAVLVREKPPELLSALALLSIGASGYGLSLRFYLLAQREIGAGRTGSVFAFAPFIGAMGALALGTRSGTWMLATGGVLMLFGVALHLFESHAHEHSHEPVEHEHAHRHDDGHHVHAHNFHVTGSHSHVHHHASVRHTHAHVPDAHHAHSHA